MKKFDVAKLRKWLQDPRNRTLAIALLAMLVLIVGAQLYTPKTEEQSNEEAPTVDTYIPEGYVLVPIELQNVESLSSLVGGYAIVDLFRGASSQRVGRRLRLLRAPQNPQQFAVFVPEDQVSALLQTPGPFWAVIQNPQQSKKTEITSKKTAKRSRIEYFKEN